MKTLIKMIIVVAVFGATGCVRQQSSSNRESGLWEKRSALWLERQFPQLTNCTPSDLYFDPEAKNSNGRLLERKGYHAGFLDEQFARFEIAENFYGERAFQLAIPTGTNSIYEVRVKAGAKKLADAIQKRTGVRLEIYRAGFKAVSATAYIVPDGEDQSRFVCATFVGE